MHVHVRSPDGEAKIWLEPQIELAASTGLSRAQTRETIRLVKQRADEIRDAWEKHFGD